MSNKTEEETIEHEEIQHDKNTKKNIVLPIVSGLALAGLAFGMYHVGFAHQAVKVELASLSAGMNEVDNHDHAENEDGVPYEEQMKVINSDEGQDFIKNTYDNLAASEFSKDQATEMEKEGLKAEFNKHISTLPKLQQFIYKLPIINKFQDDLTNYDKHAIDDAHIEMQYFMINNATMQCDLLPKYIAKTVKAEELVETYFTLISNQEDFNEIANYCKLSLDEKQAEKVYNEIEKESDKLLDSLPENNETTIEGTD